MSEADSTVRCRTLIIGGGFGGLGLAIRLAKAGLDDFLLLEKQADVGGVWWANRYPGAACDVPTALYSFSFESGFDWSRKYPQQGEILAYLRHCADRYRLRPHIRLNCEATAARWDAARQCWVVAAADGTRYEADNLCAACGILRRPLIPALPGMEDFAGPLMHTARWDPAVDFAGSTVAVIGTGASAVQVIPELARTARRVHVFQRSAPYCIPRGDRAYGRFERALRRRLPWLRGLDRLFTYLNFELMGLGFIHAPLIMQELRRRWRANLRRGVADPALRRQLTPDYAIGCKRVLITSEYYQALSAPQVELHPQGVAGLTAAGVVAADGTHTPCDAVVLATGFRALDFLAPLTVTGSAGQTLAQAWADGPRAYKGVTVHGFPNLYLLYGPNTNLGHNSIVYMLESQFNYIISALTQQRGRGLGPLQVKRERLEAWAAAMQRRQANTPWSSGCRSWYLDEAGNNYLNWPGLTPQYRRQLRRFDLADYDVLAR